MKIIILGATGQVGGQLVTESLSRGHTVTALARYPDVLPPRPQLELVKADVTAYAGLSPILAGHDAVLSAVPFLALEASALISAVKRSAVQRLLVVGGAGSLEITPGKRLVDTPSFPSEYKAEALAGVRFLETLRQESELAWTFISPSAYLHAGSRTGRFRLGQDTLLVDSQGESHLSLADFAIAFVDELERPAHPRSRFTVGY